jgi:ribonuclease BN (tRNA processing enzyme)
MRIKILGCSGGVGPSLRTTSLLIDDEILIDAGTGVGDLALSQMRRIRHVVLSHAHLDHVCGLAFMADNLFDLIDSPITVHAAEATLSAIRAHIFNWKIWPDFSQLPNPENPLLRWQPLPPGERLDLGEQRVLHSFEVLHTVPAVGLAVQAPSGVFAFSGDTWACESLWAALNALPRLDLLMIEIAFPDEQEELGATSKHFTPSLLARELSKLKHRPQLLLTHHKPGTEALIQRQCAAVLAGWNYHHLESGEIFML